MVNQPNELSGDVDSSHNPAIRLTSIEKKVLLKLSEGYATADTADELTVSENTTKTHDNHVLRKLNVTSRAQAVRRAYELTILD